MLKRNKLIILLMIVISVSSMAGIFGGKGSGGGSLKKIIKILETMQKNSIRNEFRDDNNKVERNRASSKSIKTIRK